MSTTKWIAVNGGPKTWHIGRAGGPPFFAVTCRAGSREDAENIRDVQSMLKGLNSADANGVGEVQP